MPSKYFRRLLPAFLRPIPSHQWEYARLIDKHLQTIKSPFSEKSRQSLLYPEHSRHDNEREEHTSVLFHLKYAFHIVQAAARRLLME